MGFGVNKTIYNGNEKKNDEKITSSDLTEIITPFKIFNWTVESGISSSTEVPIFEFYLLKAQKYFTFLNLTNSRKL